MKKIKNAMCFSVIMCFAYVLLHYGSMESIAAPNQLEKIKLQLKWKHQFQFAGYYAAVEKGFYRERGLEVTLIEAEPGLDVADAVIKGRADYGIATSDLVLLRSRGLPVVALASVFQHSPLVILASVDSGIETIHDLAGKRLMMEYHADELTAYIQQEKVPVKKISILPHSMSFQALLDGEIDAMSAYVTTETFNLNKERFKYTVLNPRSAGIDFYGDTLFTTEHETKKNPGRVKDFVEASMKGWAYALSNKKEMISIIQNVYHSERNEEELLFEAEVMDKLILPDVVEIGYMNEGRWKYIADVYAQMGMIKPGFDVSELSWKKDQKTDLSWLYMLIAGFFVCFSVVTGVAISFYRMNRLIKFQVRTLEETASRLNEAEFRYRSLLDNAPFAVVITRLSDDGFLYVNSEASNMVGIKPDQILKKSISDFYHEHGSGINACRQVIRQGFVRDLEVELINGKNQVIWVSLSGGITDYKGENSIIWSFSDITQKKRSSDESKKLVEELRKALANVKTLTGLLPICSGCKKIRDDKGYWNQIEAYISTHSEALFSHGLCPECMERLYPDVHNEEN